MIKENEAFTKQDQFCLRKTLFLHKSIHFWEKNLNLWDVCTGILLVKEAGGEISEPSGNKWLINSRDILASNSIIHKKIKDKLSKN